jgi:hypothetical protein
MVVGVIYGIELPIMNLVLIYHNLSTMHTTNIGKWLAVVSHMLQFKV